MTYYIYHIPGKKIGLTCDLNNRVTVQQGYDSTEYEILENSDDIDYISSKEIELQREYGYKVDMVPYKNLKPKTSMNINVTEQTTTFPCPINKLKGQLFDNIGMSWETEHGKLDITPKTIDWIMKNVKTSMFNNDRSYVYNKALWEAFTEINSLENLVESLKEEERRKLDIPIYDLIRYWANERGIYEKGNSHTQYVKLQEEAGELAKALDILASGGEIDYVGATAVELIGPGESAGNYRQIEVSGGKISTVQYR